MFRILHRAIFQAHVTTGLLASFALVHRALSAKPDAKPTCLVDRVLAKMSSQFKPKQRYEMVGLKNKTLKEVPFTQEEMWRYYTRVFASTTALTTGGMALLGATWVVAYPALIYLSQYTIDKFLHDLPDLR